MRKHKLKTWREPFAAVWDGRKHYEIRRDDRGFDVGDTLVLQEWDERYVDNAGAICDPGTVGASLKGYTGREMDVAVTYMTPPSTWGLPPEICVMSIKLLWAGDDCRRDRGAP